MNIFLQQKELQDFSNYHHVENWKVQLMYKMSMCEKRDYF